MTIALYMDVHVHRAISTGLRMRGVDILTAQEDCYRTAPDNVLLGIVSIIHDLKAEEIAYVYQKSIKARDDFPDGNSAAF